MQISLNKATKIQTGTYWNYNCYGESAKLLHVAHVDTTVYDTESLVLKDGEYEGHLSIIDIQPLNIKHSSNDAQLHLSVAAYSNRQAFEVCYAAIYHFNFTLYVFVCFEIVILLL